MGYKANDIAKLIEIIKKRDRIILYGAGLVGGLVYEWLRIIGLGRMVFCYVNSNVEEPFEYKGLRVNDIHSIDINDSSDVILICSLSDKHVEMSDVLDQMGINSYIVISAGLHSIIEREYIEYRRNLVVNDKHDYDVIVFSQDNNATSGAFISMACLCEEIHGLAGYSFLVVLPRYGDGERVLDDKGLDYTYFYRETTWIKRDDGIDEPGVQLQDENEIGDLCQLISKSGARLVHMSGAFVFAGCIAAKRMNIPTIWHLRENIVTQGNRFINHTMAYQILNSADRIICVSEHVKKAFPDLDKNRVRVIYNGADDKTFYKKRRIFDNKPISIVMVGYLTKLKGQGTLVRAVEILKRKLSKYDMPHITFVGGGDSDYLSSIQEYITINNLTDYFTFIGRTATPSKYYHSSDIAISSTLGGEGFDRVRIEAMLAGCLLLSNDAGAAREIVRDKETGYLYESGKETALADLILNVMRDVHISRKVAENGQAICMKEFTKRHNAMQVLNVYMELIG